MIPGLSPGVFKLEIGEGNEQDGSVQLDRLGMLVIIWVFLLNQKFLYSFDSGSIISLHIELQTLRSSQSSFFPADTLLPLRHCDTVSPKSPGIGFVQSASHSSAWARRSKYFVGCGCDCCLSDSGLDSSSPKCASRVTPCHISSSIIPSSSNAALVSVSEGPPCGDDDAPLKLQTTKGRLRSTGAGRFAPLVGGPGAGSDARKNTASLCQALVSQGVWRSCRRLDASRKDWVQHENSEHHKVWRCPEHENKVFESIGAYQRHLQERHAGSIRGEASLARIIQASESVADAGKRACPICTVELDTGRAMEGHIALHLERFASFSLPRSVDNDEDGSSADSGKANRVDEEGSRDDDFEGAFEYHSQVNSSGTQSAGGPPEVGILSARDGTGAFGDTPLEDVEGLGSSDESSSSDSGQSQDEIPTDRLKVGEWCADFEKYEKVEREFLETLEQTERRLGSEHVETRNCMKRVYDLFRGQKKFAEAEHILRGILEQSERALGHDHEETWASMSELGYLLHEQGRYAESEQVNWEVLTLREKAWGREDPETLVSLSNLAIALSLQGKVAEAEVLGREAMEARKRLLGPSHKNTLISTANLAHMLMGLGRVDEAERLCGEVIEIQKQEFGHDHPETLISMKRMAQVLYAQNKVDETEKLELEVMEAFRQRLGSTHPDTLASLYTVASFWHSQGRWDEAVELMDECFQLRYQVLGPDHQYNRAAAKNLEEWRAQLGGPTG